MFNSIIRPPTVTDMLMAILSVTSKEELDEELATESPMDEVMVDAPSDMPPSTSGEGTSEAGHADGSSTPDNASPTDIHRRQVIKNKILAVGRLARIFGTLREESENVTELKSRMGVDKLPYATLALGAEGIKGAIMSFEQAKMADIENERLPAPGEHASIPRKSTPPVPEMLEMMGRSTPPVADSRTTPTPPPAR